MGFLDYLDEVEVRLEESVIVEEPVVKKVVKKPVVKKKIVRKVDENRVVDENCVVDKNCVSREDTKKTVKLETAALHASSILDGLDDENNDYVMLEGGEGGEDFNPVRAIKMPADGDLTKLPTKSHASMLL